VGINATNNTPFHRHGRRFLFAKGEGVAHATGTAEQTRPSCSTQLDWSVLPPDRGVQHHQNHPAQADMGAGDGDPGVSYAPGSYCAQPASEEFLA
jgi:hypothetical protein